VASSLITREHLSRSPRDDRLDGLIADIFARNVIDGPEPPPVMLDFQTHPSAPILRYTAHALASLARVRFQAVVSHLFIHHRVISPSLPVSEAQSAAIQRVPAGNSVPRARHPLLLANVGGVGELTCFPGWAHG
jgi:hypothetical protein